MEKRKIFMILWWAIVIIFPLTTHAEIPRTINFQGYLTQMQTPVTGVVEIVFSLYDVDTGGTALWGETRSVEVIEGQFNVILGEEEQILLGFDVPYYLGIHVVGEAEEMSPRQTLTGVGYAFNTDTLDGLDSTDFLVASGGAMTGGLDLPSDGLTAGSDQLVLTGGKVGIGTADPADKLEVSGGMLASDSGPSGSLAGIRIRENGSMRWTLLYRTWQGDDFHIYDEVLNQSVMTFQSNTGNVGIGTTSPNEKLSVAGNVNFINNNGRLSLRTPSHNEPGRFGIQFDNNALGLFLGDETEDQYFNFYTDFVKTRNFDAHLKIYGSAADSWGSYIEISHDGTDGLIRTDVGDIVFSPSGNVGIGTSLPSSKLEIEGIDPLLTLDSYGALAGIDIKQNGASKWRMAWNAGSEYLYFYQGGTRMVLQDDTGNVGIGTTSPEQKLDVNGTVKMNGLLMAAGASAGHVLTSNESGQASWQPPGEFTLPHDGSVSSSQPAMAITNTGSGNGLESRSWNSSTTGEGFGLVGEAYQPYGNGIGVRGWASGRDNQVSYGVYGAVSKWLPQETAPGGFGVFGKHGDYNNEGYLGGDLHGAYGKHNNQNYGYLGGSRHGVYGVSQWVDGYGVYGRNYNGGIGVYADTGFGSGTALYALAGAGNYAAQLEGNVEIIGEENSGSTAALRISAGSQTLLVDGNEIDSNSHLYLNNNSTGNIYIGGGGGIAVASVLEITGGSDLSERFDIRSIQTVSPSPGMVVSIDPEKPGNLMVSSRAYDRKVAGIISGGGGVRPGMLMGQDGSVASGASPVALTGRVYCRADATSDSIEPGDLLTTSDTPGHAMKVLDYGRAQGAILGKAMSSLKSGQGMVLVLVTLQ